MARRPGKARRSARPPKVDARSLGPKASSLKPQAFSWADWKITIIFAALALAASAVFFWQITRDTSLLSGILGVEYQRLMPPAKGQVRSDGGPTWTTVYKDFQARVSGQPFAAKHNAVGQLLHTVVEVERGKLNAAGVLSAARQVESTDADNWISRLALASLVDSSMADKLASERFDAIRQIIEAQPPATKATLYNQEYDRLWYETLGRYIKRVDVRANLAKWLEHGEIRDQYAALPIIQSRLSKLGTELPNSTKVITTWLDKSLTELTQTESDSGSRMLTVDLLTRSLPPTDRRLGALEQFKVEYRSEASQSPADIVSPSRSPAREPRGYQKIIQGSLVAATFATFALGGAMTLAFALITALFLRESESEQNLVRPLRWLLVLTVVGFSVSANLGMTERMAKELHSEAVVMVRAIIGIVMGVALACIMSVWFRRHRRPSREVLTLVMIAPLMIPYCMSAPILAKSVRGLGWGGVTTIAIVTMLIPLVVVFVSRQSLRLARTSSQLWLIWIVIAVAAQWRTNGFDQTRQQRIAVSPLDDDQARLGTDWHAKLGFDPSSAKIAHTSHAK